MRRSPPGSTLFPYTTLFRSRYGRVPVSASASGSVLPARAISRAKIGRHTSELQSPDHIVCRLLLEKKKKDRQYINRNSLAHRSTSTHHSSFTYWSNTVSDTL